MTETPCTSSRYTSESRCSSCSPDSEASSQPSHTPDRTYLRPTPTRTGGQPRQDNDKSAHITASHPISPLPRRPHRSREPLRRNRHPDDAAHHPATHSPFDGMWTSSNRHPVMKHNGLFTKDGNTIVWNNGDIWDRTIDRSPGTTDHGTRITLSKVNTQSHVDPSIYPSTSTTPEPDDLYEIIDDQLSADTSGGTRHQMEISSPAHPVRNVTDQTPPVANEPSDHMQLHRSPVQPLPSTHNLSVLRNHKRVTIPQNDILKQHRQTRQRNNGSTVAQETQENLRARFGQHHGKKKMLWCRPTRLLIKNTHRNSQSRQYKHWLRGSPGCGPTTEETSQTSPLGGMRLHLQADHLCSRPSSHHNGPHYDTKYAFLCHDACSQQPGLTYRRTRL